jgi:hypothetical protein
MSAPNIVNVSTITGKTDLATLSTSSLSIVANAAASNKVYKLNSIIVSNINGTSAADVSVKIVRSAINYFLARTISVPADSTLVVLGKDSGIYLEEGDDLQAYASISSNLQIIVSYEIIE